LKHGRQAIMNWLFEDEYAFKVVAKNLAQDYWRK
jgi:hypothetical protein